MTLLLALLWVAGYFPTSLALHTNDDRPVALRAHHEWNVFIVYDAMQCKGKFLLRRKSSGCRTAGLNISLYPDLQADLLDRYGLDTFEIRLSGPGVVMAEARHTGNCSYSAPFRLFEVGGYKVTMVWAFSNGLAFNELSLDWAKPLGENLLLQPVHLQCLRPKTFSVTEVCNRSNAGIAPGHWMLNKRHRNLLQNGSLSAMESWHEYKNGRDAFHDKLPVPHRLYQWIPHTCRHPFIDASTDGRKCLEGRSILFVGDSHCRLSCQKLINMVFGDDPLCPPFPRIPAETPHEGFHYACGNTIIDFVTDPFLTKLPGFFANVSVDLPIPLSSYPLSIPNRNFDHIVLSSNQHWFAGYIRKAFSIKRYLAMLQLVFSTSANRSVVFILDPPTPLRGDQYVQKYSDRRNNARILEMNRLAIELAKNYPNVVLLDQFQFTYPLLWTALDLCHFTLFPQDVMAAILLNLLCLP